MYGPKDQAGQCSCQDNKWALDKNGWTVSWRYVEHCIKC